MHFHLYFPSERRGREHSDPDKNKESEVNPRSVKQVDVVYVVFY